MDNKRLSVAQVQRIELEMLDFLDRVCSDAGIEYCLAYGSALGAYRHGGFIPWDDDMDIYVKRADCLRLFDLLDTAGNGRYRVFRPCEAEGYNHPYAKLVDSSTVVEEPKNRPVENLGVFVDLFPCDFYPSGGAQTRVKVWVANLLNKVYCQAYVRGHRDSPRAVQAAWSIASRLVSASRAHSSIERLAQKGAVDGGDFMACSSDEDRVIPANWIFPVSMGVFEGREYPVPGKIEQYLRTMYGPDYMTPVHTENACHGIARLK